MRAGDQTTERKNPSMTTINQAAGKPTGDSAAQVPSIHAKIAAAAARNAAAAPPISPEQVETIVAIFEAPRIAA